jgi:hypothetical protein
MEPQTRVVLRPLATPLPRSFLGLTVSTAVFSAVQLEHERLALDPVVLAAGSLGVAASTVVHGITSAPGRALHRRVAAPAETATG